MPDEMFILQRPNERMFDSYLAMVQESLSYGEERYSGYLLRLAQGVMWDSDDRSAFLTQLAEEERGIDLPPGLVPQSTFWLVHNDAEVVGESRLRHYLTPMLEIEGGHIGYFIRRADRRKGYGTRILALMLEKARAIGLSRALVTCDTDNIGSARIIQKNGGVFENELTSPRTGKPVSRYWITL
ncbi:MAG: GNAT family N-acetyltransferase [Armatimonadota bacterium]